MQPVHGLGEHANLVNSVNRHALLKVADEAETALVVRRVHALVETDERVLEPGVRATHFLLGFKVSAEVPRLFLRFLLCRKGFLDHEVRRFEILVQQIAGGLEHVAEVVHVLLALIAGKVRRRIKSGHVEPEKIAHGVEVFAAVQAAQDRVPAGAGQVLASPGEFEDDLIKEHLLLREAGLLGLFRRHVAEMELIHHVLQVDQGVLVGRREE